MWIVGSNQDIALPLVGSQFIDATGVVLLANALMLVTGVVEWDDILGNKGAWNVLVWFATLAGARRRPEPRRLRRVGGERLRGDARRHVARRS